ncbi:Tim44/TimA family putative adaptor protein [Enterovirga rhinocerotis]|uniref:Putative lipid-binding transport protein (Tim44 family) n=1 Tax=Enterovirga rhinocerotis TaxID=1339210 RepID=A0A4R7BRT8_9HYPH|nr:Tim44/TimA family putative adaptor protein [Enterovirga rhinocerotis]TDR87175.1 putative lipid-binding transport protein (Tim44 family) [Enterovirga rhinocerotis]
MFAEFDVTTVVFLALAVFVIWRLRSVLGQKTGHEQPPVDTFQRREQARPPAGPAPQSAQGDNVVRLPTGAGDRPAAPAAPAPDRWAGVAEADSPVARGLDEIAKIEAGFDARGFVEGAKSAYEMIVTAFAQGDTKTLKGLLSKDVFDGFERAIKDRESRGEKSETTFVSLDKAEMIGVDVRNRVAQVTLRFVSKLITATRDASGQVIDGSPEAVVDVTDVWTFARTLGARDPNWLLVATEAGQ